MSEQEAAGGLSKKDKIHIALQEIGATLLGILLGVSVAIQYLGNTHWAIKALIGTYIGMKWIREIPMRFVSSNSSTRPRK